MKNRAILSLLAALLAALVLLLIWDSRQTIKEEKAKENENKLLSFEVDQVQQMIYESSPQKEEPINKDGDIEPTASSSSQSKEPVKVVVDKTADGNWNMSVPLAAKADETNVDDVLSTLSSYKYDKAVSTMDKAANFGLTQPQRKITLKLKDQERPIIVNIGSKAPVGYSVYINIEGDQQIYIGSQYFLVSTAKTLRDFRDKKFASFNMDDIIGFGYKRQHQQEIIVDKQENQWMVKAAEIFEGDGEVIEAFFADILNANAEDFLDSPGSEIVKKFADNAADIILTFRFRDGKSSTMSISSHDNANWLTYNPQSLIYKLGGDTYTKFNKNIMSFRDRRILKFSPAQVTQLIIDGKEFQMKDGSWYAADTKEKNAANAANHLKNLVADLAAAKGDEFLDPKGKEATQLPAAPKHRILLGFADQKAMPTIEVSVYDSADGALYLSYPAAKFLYKTPKTVLNSITAPDPNALPQAPANGNLPMGDGHDHHEG